jgi:fructuronate reductase
MRLEVAVNLAEASDHHLQHFFALVGREWLGPLRRLRPALDRLRQGAMPRHIALVVAAWMRFLQGRDEQGRAYEINDPLAARLVRLAAAAGENAEVLAGALFGIREIFDPVLAADPGFRNEVVRAFGLIRRSGIGPAVSAATHP